MNDPLTAEEIDAWWAAKRDAEWRSPPTLERAMELATRLIIRQREVFLRTNWAAIEALGLDDANEPVLPAPTSFAVCREMKRLWPDQPWIKK